MGKYGLCTIVYIMAQEGGRVEGTWRTVKKLKNTIKLKNTKIIQVFCE